MNHKTTVLDAGQEARKLEYASRQIEQLQRRVGYLYVYAQDLQHMLEAMPVRDPVFATRVFLLRETLKEAAP